MARSTREGRTTGTKKTKFGQFIESIKQSLKIREDGIIKERIDEQKEYEENIIEALNDLRFSPKEVKLPLEYLEYKTNDKQPVGDLECSMKAIKNKIIRDELSLKNVNIKDFDKKVCALITKFQKNLKEGNVKGTYAARSAIVFAVDALRSKFGSVSEELRQSYVDKCTEYLDVWFQFIYESAMLEENNKECSKQKKEYQAKKDAEAKKRSEFKSKVESDVETLEAIRKIQNEKAVDEKENWPPNVQEVYNKMIKMKIEKSNLSTSFLLLDATEKEILIAEHRVEALKDAISQVPKATDKNATAKFDNIMKSFFKSINDVHQDFENFVDSLKNMEDCINEITHSRANKLANRMALEQLDKLVEDYKNTSKEKNQQKSLEELRKEVLKIKKEDITEEFLKEQEVIEEDDDDDDD